MSRSMASCVAGVGSAGLLAMSRSMVRLVTVGRFNAFPFTFALDFTATFAFPLDFAFAFTFAFAVR
ncbi:MAG: hypothetical protein IT359_17185 [Gemmatimonadaceae bacterium]|nr:hypothetical protein [Gemmatimonadaceae bacterium]